MDEEYEITEHLTTEQISSSIWLMCLQQIRFEAEMGSLREALVQPLPGPQKCEAVARNPPIMDLWLRDGVTALRMNRDEMEERIAVLKEKVQRLNGLIHRFCKLRSSLPATNGGTASNAATISKSQSDA